MNANKVAWSDGMFLRAHLFQQQERYFENYANQRTLPLSPFYWGFSQFGLDESSLSSGKLTLRKATGIFKDGTPFEIPHSVDCNPAIQITEADIGQIIHFATPARQPQGNETIFSEDDNVASSLARFLASDVELFDSSSISRGTQVSQLSRLRVRLLSARQLNENWVSLPVARVTSVLSSQEVLLDPNFVPPVSRIGCHPWLFNWVEKIMSLCNIRSQNLAERLTAQTGKNQEAAEVSDYLLLQLLNRYTPLLQHHFKLNTSPPLELYTLFLSFAGELATFVRPKTRLPSIVPNYIHLDPYLNFNELIEDLHKSLNEVLVRSAERLILQDRENGVRVTTVDPTVMEQFGSVILAVSADMPMETLIAQFASQAKVAAPGYLPELIRLHLPGVPLNALPVPPRQIPYHSGYAYYELAQSNNSWAEIVKSGGIALHVAGKFPGLKLELWGVRDSK